MFELTFLGTSASAPSVARNVSSSLLTYREYRFLIDAGEGTQRQLLKSGLGFRKLERVLLTHAHLDHILGLAGMVSTLNRWDVEQERFQIYGTRQTLNQSPSCCSAGGASNNKEECAADVVMARWCELRESSAYADARTERCARWHELHARGRARGAALH